jgi:DNA-directed RNA polymerase specialized sigma24 family protein
VKGWVDPEVYRAAGEVWGKSGEALAHRLLGHGPAGLPFMREAAARVTHYMAKSSAVIGNLEGYVFRTYERLLLAEVRHRNKYQPLDQEALDTQALSWMGDTDPGDVERDILLEQIISLMDEWTREVFELRVLGHGFEFIAGVVGMRSNHVRSLFHKRMQQLMKQVNG